MFKITKVLLSVSMLGMGGLALAPNAGATAGDALLISVLNTSANWADSGSYHSCNLANTSLSQVTVSVALIDTGGSVITQAVNVSVGAGAIYELDESAGTGWARCRFTLNDSPSSIRANGTVFHSNGDGTYIPYEVSDAH